MKFLKCRFGERSTYMHLVQCATLIGGVAFGLSWSLIFVLIGLSLLGAMLPDGSVVRKP